MSRYSFKHRDLKFSVGWDNKLNTFFLSVSQNGNILWNNAHLDGPIGIGQIKFVIKGFGKARIPGDILQRVVEDSFPKSTGEGA